MNCYRRHRLTGALRTYAMTFAFLMASPAFAAKFGDPTPGTGAVITWSLMPTGASSADSGSIVDLADFMPTGYTEQIQAAFDKWSEVANVTFVQVADTGPNGAIVRIGGHAFDGLGGTAAHGYYPTTNPAGGDIHFDIGETWVTTGTGLSQGGAEQDIYSVMLHELGHAVFDMEHTVGAISVLNAPPTSTAFTPELMPYDIAAAQSLYGVAPGYLSPPPANASLALDPSSSVQMTVSAFDGQVSFSATASLTGSLQARIEHGSDGLPMELAIRDAELSLGNLSGSVDTQFIDVAASILGGQGWLYSTQSQLIDASGLFDAGSVLFGIVDGDFAIDANILGTEASGFIDLFGKPVSIGTLPGQATGSLLETPSAFPGTNDVLLTLPVHASVILDGSLFLDGIDPGQLPVTITIDAWIHASGSVAVVPETSSMALALVGVIGFAGFLHRRARQMVFEKR